MLNVLLTVFTHNPQEFSARMEKVNTPCFEHYFLQSNYRTCIHFLTKTCLRSWDLPLNCVDYPNYNPDSGSGLLSGSLGGGLYFCTVLGVIVHVFLGI